MPRKKSPSRSKKASRSKTKKTIKKASAAKAAKKTALETPKLAQAIKSTQATPQALQQKQLLIGAIIILLLALAYYFRGIFVAAIVNGRPISRLAVVRELEKQQAAAVLDQLIVETLILQEAQKQNATVSQEEINAQVAQIKTNLEEQGQELDQFLQLQGMTQPELEKNIRLQKLVEMMLADKVEVTDEEIAQYLEDNKDLLPEDQDEAQLQATAEQQLRQQKLGQAFQEWLAELREQANINYLVKY